jgi:hypothetical protein
MLTVVADGCPGHEGGKDRSPSLIDEIVREGARRMLAGALQAEVDAYIAGALGFWGALREVFPEAREGRCWFQQDRQRAGRAAHLVALVRAGAVFRDGVLAERSEQAAA